MLLYKGHQGESSAWESYMLGISWDLVIEAVCIEVLRVLSSFHLSTKPASTCKRFGLIGTLSSQALQKSFRLRVDWTAVICFASVIAGHP